MNLDIDFIQSQFPAFREPSLAGWAFFENAGGSYMCQQVIDRLMTFYTQTKVQPGYPYPASTEAENRMQESYARLSAYLNIDEDELSFGPSTSQNVYVLAQALYPMWQESDEIIISCQNHEANSGAWRRLENQGIVVRNWHVDENTGQLAVDDLDDLITERTRLIAFPHTSNLVAHINPVREIADKAHKSGIIVVADGVSYAPHGLPDIQELGADIYLFSLYKTWGPHLGAMYVKRELANRMTNQSHFYYSDEPHYRLSPAGPDHAQIAAAAGVADYLDAVYAHHFDDDPESAIKGRRLHQLFSDYEISLLTPLLDFLKTRDDVLIIGPDDPSIRSSTVTIVPLKKPVATVAAELEKQKLMIASGDFDATRIFKDMNIEEDPGAIRLSFIHYTTRNDIDRLISGLAIALGQMTVDDELVMIEDTNIIPLPPVDWGDGIEIETVLLELTTPEGITGLGSAYSSANQMRDGLARYQQDPVMLHNFDAEMAIPMSAIDIALWDIRGKEQNLPISELLGGSKRDRVLAYATVILPFTSAVAGDAFDKALRAILAQGFKAIKLSIDYFGHRYNSKSDSEWDRCEAKLLAFARSIAGENIQLMLDVYGSDQNWTPDFDWAVKTTKVLEELDYLWFEEPLTPEAFDDYAQLTQGSQIAIAGAEDFILLQDFEKLSKLKALNIMQPDCTRVGGLTQMQAIRSAASLNNIDLIPHGWNTAVGLAADLQFQATLADDKFCMVEYMPRSIITDLLKHNPFALDNEGKITLPTGAGLGIELKDKFRKNVNN